MGREEELRYECFQTVWTATSRIFTHSPDKCAGDARRCGECSRASRPPHGGHRRHAWTGRCGMAQSAGPAAGRTDVQTAVGPGTAPGLFLPTISPRQAQSGDRGGLKSETPLPLLDEALLSLPKFFSIKRSHRQRRVCAGPASHPATRLPHPSPPLRAETASEPAPLPACARPPAGANTWVLRGGRRPRRRALSMFPSSRAGHPGGPACLSAFTPHAHGLCTESESRPRNGSQTTSLP